jgi:hypothetical protein
MVESYEIDDILDELDVLQRRLMETPDVAEPVSVDTRIEQLRSPSQRLLDGYLRMNSSTALLRVPSVVRITETDNTNVQLGMNDLLTALDLYESTSDLQGVGVCHGLLGVPPPKAVFLGMLVALSSTAIVLKLYSTSGELDSPQGRVVLGILSSDNQI